MFLRVYLRGPPYVLPLGAATSIFFMTFLNFSHLFLRCIHALLARPLVSVFSYACSGVFHWFASSLRRAPQFFLHF